MGEISRNKPSEQSIGRLIDSLFGKIRAFGKLDLWGLNLTTSQIQILMFLGMQTKLGKKVFQKDIEKEFNIKASSVTSALKNLEKNKWIRRESVDYDARLKSIVFAERANMIIEYTMKISEKFDDIMKSSISEAEFIVFCQCIYKMQAALDKNRDSIKEESAKFSKKFLEENNYGTEGLCDCED
jgi:DNA-binding MarR family transcriptional regulator